MDSVHLLSLPAHRSKVRPHGASETSSILCVFLIHHEAPKNAYDCDSDSDSAAARHPVSPRRHGGHGDFTETSGFSVHLRVLRVSVVNKVLEFFLGLASHDSSGS